MKPWYWHKMLKLSVWPEKIETGGTWLQFFRPNWQFQHLCQITVSWNCPKIQLFAKNGHKNCHFYCPVSSETGHKKKEPGFLVKTGTQKNKKECFYIKPQISCQSLAETVIKKNVRLPLKPQFSFPQQHRIFKTVIWTPCGLLSRFPSANKVFDLLKEVDLWLCFWNTSCRSPFTFKLDRPISELFWESSHTSLRGITFSGIQRGLLTSVFLNPTVVH